MSAQQRRKYDTEFKKIAVLLNQKLGRSMRDVADGFVTQIDICTNGDNNYMAKMK